jgi:adenylylsulfate kinase
MSPVFWFTGLSGAGKTTVALAVKRLLEAEGRSVKILDGDEVRARFHTTLGFSEADVKENNRLISELCKEHRQNHDVVLVPIISPFASSRDAARDELGEGFFEIFCNANLDCVVSRDTKGLYGKAQRNEMNNLIGFSDGYPYETPVSPDLIIHSGRDSLDLSAKALFDFVMKNIPVVV